MPIMQCLDTLFIVLLTSFTYTHGNMHRHVHTYAYKHASTLYIHTNISDGAINRNRVSEVLGVFLESVSEEVDHISDLGNDSL